MISKKLLKELKEILIDEFKLQLNEVELNKLANYLVGYFNLLIKIESRK